MECIPEMSLITGSSVINIAVSGRTSCFEYPVCEEHKY
jgi:hypothetical protein